MNAQHSITITLPRGDAEFVETYATEHRMSVDDVIDRLIQLLQLTPATNRGDGFSEDYLASLISQARGAWESVTDPDAWLRELRGYSDRA